MKYELRNKEFKLNYTIQYTYYENLKNGRNGPCVNFARTILEQIIFFCDLETMRIRLTIVFYTLNAERDILGQRISDLEKVIHI